MRIGVDCDGVVLDYMKTARAYAELYDIDVAGTGGMADRSAIYARERYKWTAEVSKKFGEEFFVKLTREAPVFALAAEMIRRLRSEGHQLYMVSNRVIISPKHVAEAERVFARNKIVFDGIFWTGDKIKTILENKLDLMIDDDNRVAEACAASNIRCLFMRDKNTPEVRHALVREVDNWPEIYRVVSRGFEG